MAPLLEHERVAVKNHNRYMNYRACDHLTNIGYYFVQLSKSGRWPTVQKCHKTSIIAISVKAVEIQGVLGWGRHAGLLQ